MPTVQHIWRALPGDTGLVAGEPGIYNEVSWVVTLKPTPPAGVRPWSGLRSCGLRMINPQPSSPTRYINKFAKWC